MNGREIAVIASGTRIGAGIDLTRPGRVPHGAALGAGALIWAWLQQDDEVADLSPALETGQVNSPRAASFAGGAVFQYVYSPADGDGFV